MGTQDYFSIRRTDEAQNATNNNSRS